ncbi:MAG: MraY family glycosyltransferase [Bacteroidales bacterium]|nr:MraY family glycosyltransferase [Bacteroidales bacterium]
MQINILIAFIVSLLTGLFLNNFLIKRPLKFLVKKANNSAIRFSTQSKPIFGGVGFYVVFIILIISALFILQNEVYQTSEYISIVLIVTLSFIMGLADDLISTPPSFKFIVQFLCAFIFIFNGIYIQISPYEWYNYIITVLWVVGIMNSINMLDNMDAVTALTSLSIIGGAALFGVVFDSGISNFIVLVLISTSAALISFIFYNWHPAKMYMGDNGSQFLGAILALVGIVFYWNAVPIEDFQYGYNLKQIIIVACAFIVPLSDTTTVTINRLLRKKSPFVGGRDHTTHHLFYLGLSVRWIGIVLFLINSIGVALSLYLINTGGRLNYNYLWFFAAYPIIVFLLLYINTKITKQK